jgi:hypothetical protein
MRNSALLFVALIATAQTKPGGIEGTVVNALTGEPVARASVKVAAKGKHYGAATDAEGKFAIAAVDPGAYDFSCERVGFLPSSESVEIGSELTTRRTVKLMPEGSISGRVVDPDGQPVEGAAVVARGAARALSAITNDRGEFRIEHLPADRFRVLAKPSRPLIPPEIRTDGTKEDHLDDTSYSGSVEVAAGAQVEGIEIRLIRTPLVRVSGTITGGGTSPIRVETEAAEDATSHRQGIVEGGKFTVWNLPPGKHRLWARSGTLSSASVEVDVGGTDIEGIELALMLPFEVRGRVDWEGTPPAEPKLLEFELQPPFSLRQPLDLNASADGALYATGVEPERYEVRAPRGAYIRSMFLGAVEERDGVLDLSRGAREPVLIRVSAAVASVSGVIRDAKAVVAEANVELERAGYGGRPQWESSRADGSYAFANLAPGHYKLTVTAANHEAVVEEFDLDENAKLAKDIKLP